MNIDSTYYVTASGNECPFTGCHSRNINTLGCLNTDGDYAWREVECHDCGGIWHETYTLTGAVALPEGPTEG